jgi:hypothetical protein
MTTPSRDWYAERQAEADDLAAQRQAKLEQIQAERENAAKREAEADARRHEDQAKVAAHYDQLRAPRKVAARAQFFLAHPTAAESTFETYWDRVKPSREELDEEQVQQVMAEMAGRPWPMGMGTGTRRMVELGPED